MNTGVVKGRYSDVSGNCAWYSGQYSIDFKLPGVLVSYTCSAQIVIAGSFIADDCSCLIVVVVLPSKNFESSLYRWRPKPMHKKAVKIKRIWDSLMSNIPIFFNFTYTLQQKWAF